MNIFFTSTSTPPASDFDSKLYMPMEETLKQGLAGKEYGNGLDQWFLMFVLISPGFPGHNGPERVMFKKKACKLDMRLNLDFEAFVAGDEAARRTLLWECMLRSLDLMAGKKIPNFDATALKEDVMAIGEAEGWSQ